MIMYNYENGPYTIEKELIEEIVTKMIKPKIDEVQKFYKRKSLRLKILSR